MTMRGWRMACGGLLACAVLSAFAQQSAGTPARRSGFDGMSASLQAMQRDDLQNPGMLWVADGEALWSQAGGGNGRSCASCHGDARQSMRGVATRYPDWDRVDRRPVDLAQRINHCRVRHQAALAWPHESKELLSLETFVAHQSRGQPLQPSTVPALAAARERGLALYTQRIGQLNLSCMQCHDALAGRKLAGSAIPQGHANGYPIYRLEWQAVGSVRRRIRNCMVGVRAEPFAPDSAEMVALELYLAQRSAGLAVETPAVRP